MKPACANGRSLFKPPIEGEKWLLGAVSTAEWTGVPLAEVLDRAGVRVGAWDVVFKGADNGSVAARPGLTHFERSLQLDRAREPDVLLAYAMNGEALPVQHGFPLRLIVPGWYAVASVKWLTNIEVIDRPFAGHYQTEKYWYEWERGGQTVRDPVTRTAGRRPFRLPIFPRVRWGAPTPVELFAPPLTLTTTSGPRRTVSAICRRCAGVMRQ